MAWRTHASAPRRNIGSNLTRSAEPLLGFGLDNENRCQTTRPCPTFDGGAPQTKLDLRLSNAVSRPGAGVPERGVGITFLQLTLY